jgi:hypothetical protein
MDLYCLVSTSGFLVSSVESPLGAIEYLRRSLLEFYFGYMSETPIPRLGRFVCNFGIRFPVSNGNEFRS